MAIKSLVGNKYGRLEVIADSGKRDKFGSVMWLCKCSCGNTVELSASILRSTTQPRSCGCLRVEKSKETKYPRGIKPVGESQWKAYIGYLGEYIDLGTYDSKEEALNARKAGEIKYLGKEC